MNIDLSIIIPALNEEKNISKTINNCLSALNSLKINGELICINDGSTDKTESEVRKIMKSYKRVRLINHSYPQGFGSSFWHGVKFAKGNAVTWKSLRTTFDLRSPANMVGKLRNEGMMIYENRTSSGVSYRVGAPSKAVIAAGQTALFGNQGYSA